MKNKLLAIVCVLVLLCAIFAITVAFILDPIVSVFTLATISILLFIISMYKIFLDYINRKL